MEPNIIDRLHDFRVQIDACIKRAEAELARAGEDNSLSKPAGREMALVRTKLQEAKMWVGKCLEVTGSELPQEYRDEAK